MEIWFVSSLKWQNLFHRLLHAAGIDQFEEFREYNKVDHALKSTQGPVHILIHDQDLDLINGGTPIGAQADKKKMASVLKALHDKYPQVTIHLFSEETDYSSVAYFFPINVRSILCLNSSLFEMTLINLFGSLRGQTPPNLSEVLGYGAQLRSESIKESSGITDTITDFRCFLKDIKAGRQIVEKASMLSEELMMNGVFGAPQDEKGEFKYHLVDRKQNLQLLPKEHVKFMYGCNTSMMGVSVRDNFGSLSVEKLCHYFSKVQELGNVGPEAYSTGGGLGLFYILRNAQALLIHLDPGKYCEIVGLYDIKVKRNATGQELLNFIFCN